MEDKIINLIENVKKLADNPEFIHHKWFIKYHIEIVERISLELLEKYPNADRNAVIVLVWVHDYLKIVDMRNEHNLDLLHQVKDFLMGLNFEEAFVNKVISLLNVFEQKLELDLTQAPIEVQIVSSADGASHLVGPFYAIHYQENHEKDLAELTNAAKNKLTKDWNRKIVLPEVKEAFKQIYLITMGQVAGELPVRFL